MPGGIPHQAGSGNTLLEKYKKKYQDDLNHKLNPTQNILLLQYVDLSGGKQQGFSSVPNPISYTESKSFSEMFNCSVDLIWMLHEIDRYVIELAIKVQKEKELEQESKNVSGIAKFKK